MKIVHCTPYYWPHKGGVETHVAAVCKALEKDGHEVTVLTVQHDPKLPLVEKIDGIDIRRMPLVSSASKIETWKWIWQHRSVLQAVDVIHIHDVVWWLYPFCMFYFKLFGTFHGWEGHFPVPWRIKTQRWLASKIVKGSMHVGAWIQEFYWDKPQVVTYGGVDVADVSRKKIEFSKKKLYVVFIGRLEAVNEIEKYIELVKLLKQHNPKTKVTWIGDGSWRKECEQIGNVTGMIDNTESHLENADVVLANSYLSILEAQARGKLVVSFFSHHLKEQYLKTYPGSKWMLIANEPHKMVEKITACVSDLKMVRRFSDGAQSFAKTQTWYKVTQQYYQLWSAFIH